MTTRPQHTAPPPEVQMEPELYVSDGPDTYGLQAPNRITEPLLGFLPRLDRHARGSAASMHRFLLPYYRAMRQRGIRFQRVSDHRLDGGPEGMLRTRRYHIWLGDGWHGGDLLVTTRWQGGRLGIVEVRAPVDAWATSAADGPLAKTAAPGSLGPPRPV